MLSSIPDTWGPKFQQAGGAVTSTQTGPNSIYLAAPAHMAVVMFTPQPGRQISTNSDRKIKGTAPTGALEIIPAQSDYFARWSTSKRNLLVMVEPSRLERLAGLEFDQTMFELYPPSLGSTDLELYSLAKWMHCEVGNSETGSATYLDSLVTVFAIYLLRNYSSLKNKRLPLYDGRLPSIIWRRVNDFIHSHLHENLPLERLASIAGISPSHFSRMFRQTTGQSPHQYLVNVRLSFARHLIRNTGGKFNDIAKLAGFSNNSRMTAIMRQKWQETPTEIRNNV